MPPPLLFIIAGPNGAGKTTLYREVITRQTSAPFINADLLAERHFGHPARTEAESVYGQEAADAMRKALMARGQSLITESTFSHPSKLDLIAQAKAAGYRVFVYHIGLDDPDEAVARVTARVEQGGHPVPEDRIRARYERNRPLIREAVLGADRGLVFDNSVRRQPPRLVLHFRNGVRQDIPTLLPPWVREVYEQDIAP